MLTKRLEDSRKMEVTGSLEEMNTKKTETKSIHYYSEAIQVCR